MIERSLVEALSYGTIAALTIYMVRQCRKPTGPLGQLIVRVMNRSHSGLTTWGLQHVTVGRNDIVLDIGCGGGRTIQKLAQTADLGKIYGVDYASASVSGSRSFNKALVASGRVQIQHASVSHLPFEDQIFDLVTAVETHYYWPDLDQDLLEIRRVLKPGGSVLIIAEAFRGQKFDLPNRIGMKLIGGGLLTADEHLARLVKAGYADSQVFVEEKKDWICVTGRKPN